MVYFTLEEDFQLTQYTDILAEKTDVDLWAYYWSIQEVGQDEKAIG